MADYRMAWLGPKQPASTGAWLMVTNVFPNRRSFSEQPGGTTDDADPELLVWRVLSGCTVSRNG